MAKWCSPLHQKISYTLSDFCEIPNIVMTFRCRWRKSGFGDGRPGGAPVLIQDANDEAHICRAYYCFKANRPQIAWNMTRRMDFQAQCVLTSFDADDLPQYDRELEYRHEAPHRRFASTLGRLTRC